MSELTITYKGTDIEYHEYDDVWRFELYGKERKAESLSNAKKAIDAPAPQDKRKFKPVRAYLKNYRGLSVVTVTAEADQAYRSSTQFWVKDSKGSRTKEDSNQLFVYGPANEALAKEASEYQSQARSLEEQASACYAKMARFPGLQTESEEK